MTFSDRELELAHQLAALGTGWEPLLGNYVYDDRGTFPLPGALHPHVYVILDLDYFTGPAGGVEALRTQWTWLPTWEEGRAWLRARGRNDAEVLDRLRERIVDTGMSDREALYEQMIAVLRQERAVQTPATA